MAFRWWNQEVEGRLPKTLAHMVRSPVLKEYGRDHPWGPNRRRPERHSCQ